MHKQDGFGIVELLIGVVVLGLLGWGAFTLYTSRSEEAIKDGSRVEQEAEDLSDDADSRNDALERATNLQEEN